MCSFLQIFEQLEFESRIKEIVVCIIEETKGKKEIIFKINIKERREVIASKGDSNNNE